MSTSSSNAQARLEMPPSIRPGCLRNVGWKSSFLAMVSYMSRMKSGPDALGRLEQLQTRDVHRVFAGFADEEHRVGRRDQLHGCDGTHSP